ncbi:hypothetical protein [Paenibacillus alvei]|uniref:hypothetical protein n=1 Tax=Paenibacillus alvei TaxID=44250 RepID=UPI002280EEBC|nr:hypothetical protein [Paenibacillus alvei]MCY7484237.1 hypothetical protein [Paenibacillus alvei]
MGNKMFKHKNKILITLSIVLVFGLSYYFFMFNSYHGVVNAQSLYIGADNASDLVDMSDLIIVGTPIEEFDEREHKVTYFYTSAIQDFYTITEMKVEQVLKGNWDESTLPVIEPISYIQSIDGKRKLTSNDYTEMEKGKKYLVVLSKNTQGNYSVINMDNGKFELDENNINYHELNPENNKHVKIRYELFEMFNYVLAAYKKQKDPEKGLCLKDHSRAAYPNLWLILHVKGDGKYLW